MAESNRENQHNVDEVVNTLDAFHISEDHDSSSKGDNQENVFQRTDRYRDWKNKREQANTGNDGTQPTSTCSAQLSLAERRERRKQIRESWLTEGQRSSNTSAKSESQSNGSVDNNMSSSSQSSSNSDLPNSSAASVSSVDSHIEAMRQRRKQMMQGSVPDSDGKTKLNSSLDSSKTTQRRWIKRTTSSDGESKPNVPLSMPAVLGSGTTRVALTRSSSLDRRHMMSPLRQKREGSVDRMVKTEDSGNISEQWTQDDSNMGSAMKNILKSGLLMSSQTILAQRRLLDKNSKTIQSIQASHRSSQNVTDDSSNDKEANSDMESKENQNNNQVHSPQISQGNSDQDSSKSLSDIKPSFRLGRTRLTFDKKSPEHVDQNSIKSDSAPSSTTDKTADESQDQDGVTCIFRSEKDMDSKTLTGSANSNSSLSPQNLHSELERSHDTTNLGEPNSPIMNAQGPKSPSHGSVYGPTPFSGERSRHGSGHAVEKSHSSDEIESQKSRVHVPTTSKSAELPNKSELNQSSIKRMGGVTDLDKAMQESDQQKLKSLFKSNVNQDSEKNNDLERSQPESHHFSVMETDLDSPTSPRPKIHTSAKTVQKPMSVEIATDDNVHKNRREISSKQTEVTKPGEKRPKDIMYKPNVNLEDAVKSPMEVPVKLDFRHMECFEGQMLLQWLNNSIDDNHYLRLLLTRHDLQVVISQVCTCLMAAGVIKQLESKEIAENKFKTDCMYYWAHTENPVTKQNVDIGKLAPMWPPAQPCDQDIQPGQKYTEAEHQTEMVRLRKEYQEEVDKLKTEHQTFLDKIREEYQNKIQECIERIIQLHNDVEKYKALAGIEELTQAALSDAEAAGKEAGIIGRLGLNLTNGFLTPEMGERFLAVTGTPSTPESVYHTPAMTPECVSGEYPSIVMGENGELGPIPLPPDELRPTPQKAPGAPEPPPPPPPPPPGMGGAPPPPPPPLPGGGPLSRKGSLKPVINPKSPMKALFWQRIQVHEIKSPKNKEYANAKLVWESLVEPQVDSSEIENLFAKQALDTGRKSIFDRPKSKLQQFAKVIEPKRSQAVGILLSSLKMDFSEIENAILTFDTSQLGEDKLKSIYENRGEDDEIKKIKKQLKSNPDVPLDKPEQFLYDLHQIPDYGERIFCFIFQQSFQESMSVIDNKITNIKMTAETLVKGRSLRYILGLILAVGNYMNGGSRTRGQADGFGLEILPKLKDVKTKDNRASLLHFIVAQYVKKREREHAGTEHAKLPVPDPSDISQATAVNFDEIDKELRRIKKDFDAAEKRAEKVISNAGPQYLQPFKDIMTEFFSKGRQEYKEQEENLVEGKKRFEELVIYFCVKPKQGDKNVTPEYFFSLWSAFCGDFKDLWKKEQQRVIKQRIKDAQDRVRQLQERKANPLPKRARKPGGLKDRLASKGML